MRDTKKAGSFTDKVTILNWNINRKTETIIIDSNSAASQSTVKRKAEIFSATSEETETINNVRSVFLLILKKKATKINIAKRAAIPIKIYSL